MSFQQELLRIRRLCDRSEPRLRSRLTFTSGIVLSGVVALQFIPFPDFMPSGQPRPLQEGLWQSIGAVRQTIVDLYRFQRLYATPINPATAPSDSSDSSAATATTAPQAPAPPTAAKAPASQLVIDDALEMRVAIARNAASLEIGMNSAGRLVDTSGQAQCAMPAQTSFIARPNGQGINFQDCQLSGAVWVEPQNGGHIFVNGSWFRGRVLLFNNGGQLLAVNFVFLREYLSSVVGSEMYPHWPLEALKAQAVAARSYALTHHVRPASDYFDLDNTQRFQAYKGIAVETNTTQMAVAATAGEFISYQGGIVESLYAASEQIVQEAHGGQGMSQQGAKDFATQGYSYEQILATYYPGTGLSRLVVQ